LAVTVIALTIASAAGLGPDVPRRPNAHDDWSWLKGTYWYVPQENLPAVETNLETLQHEFITD